MVCFLQIPGAYLQPLSNSEGEGEVIFKTAKVFDYETFYFEVLYRQTIKICFYVYFSKTYNWIPPLKQVQIALLSRRTMRPASNS